MSNSRPNNIYLIGFMGVGKTSVGKELSKLCKLLFIDIDEKIEASSGLKIKEIFEQKGENFFRKLESHRDRKGLPE